MKFEPFVMERCLCRWENTVRLNISESGVHPLTFAELTDGADLGDTLLGYTQSNGTIPLRERIAALYPGSNVDQILVTTGTAEANFLSALTTLSPGDEVVAMIPNYMQIIGACRSLGARVIPFHLVEENGWRPDLDALDAAVSDRTKMILVCNPNNPTGSYLSRAEIQEFADRVPESVLVLVDEAYGEFVAAEEDSSLIPHAVERPNLVVARTFSKIYGLAGLRVGYMVGQAHTLRSLRKAQSPFVVSSVAEVAATTALRFPERVRERFELNRQGVDYIEGALSDRGIRYVPSQANFIWLRLGPGTPGIVQELLEMGTLIRKGTEEWTRVSVGTESENRRFVEDLDLVLRQRRP